MAGPVELWDTDFCVPLIIAVFSVFCVRHSLQFGEMCDRMN